MQHFENRTNILVFSGLKFLNIKKYFTLRFKEIDAVHKEVCQMVRQDPTSVAHLSGALQVYDNYCCGDIWFMCFTASGLI